MVLVTRQAPDFTAAAVLGNGEIVDNFNFKQHIAGKAAVVFFYPLDFTFVCPSELIAFDHRYEEFQKRGVEVVGISIDSEFSHNAWRKTPVENGGIGEVKYALVADIKHEIAQAFGIEHPEAGVALRASFLIDKDGVVRHQVVNDLPLGRNIDEMLRMVDALQFHEEHGDVCPAQWEKGKEGMTGSPEGVAKYLKQHADQL
ncbi:TPA: peroxiredoxin C [Pasteurella multocida]|uniref:Thioredoxin peroxidase n=2 Tax=Pasteurella multocida TaxID=747 RepID=Q9CMM3_PASMU|nr:MULTISPECIES: peroxiredoxin C [Pasteurella]AWW59727.1 peroxiredoxin [Pasteurellaceae bacterium 12591]EGP05330.1 TsaA [Pasteurella multocida subsp. multocida str. Anand1_goat]EGP05938.1 TsaA [Pasteurella multocida subsp. gallicida str. Anand1_poultry]AAK02879.1 TsaA [Pasteurella multocida subsp. multocida str. Pm70]AET15779.1 putative peroxiredoxin [Pasteurella multocida 36950]